MPGVLVLTRLCIWLCRQDTQTHKTTVDNQMVITSTNLQHCLNLHFILQIKAFQHRQQISDFWSTEQIQNTAFCKMTNNKMYELRATGLQILITFLIDSMIDLHIYALCNYDYHIALHSYRTILPHYTDHTPRFHDSGQNPQPLMQQYTDSIKSWKGNITSWRSLVWFQPMDQVLFLFL